MPVLEDLTWNDPATIATQGVILTAFVVTLLLLVWARLPLRTGALAVGWAGLALVVVLQSDGPSSGTADRMLSVAVATGGLALLGWYVVLWRTGRLLVTGPVRPANNEGAGDDAGHPRAASRHHPDPALAPGRHQADLRSAYTNLSRGEVRSAVRDAGPVLEDVIDSWLKRGLGVREIPDDMTMHERIGRVATMGHLTAQQRAQVSRWWGLRNRASHELGPIARADGQEMVDGVTRLAARLTRR